MEKIGRNDPCHCGSGKKYKQCCMQRDATRSAGERSQQATQKAQIGNSLQAAVEHHRAGRLAQAEALYRTVLQADPHQPEALHLLGVIAHQSGNHGLAVELIGKATRFKSSDPHYFSNLGLAYQALGRFDEAAASYRKSLALLPRQAETHFNLGNVYNSQGNTELAEASYRSTLAIDPNHPGANNNLGAALCVQGRLDDAAGYFRKAIAADPDYADAHCNLGHLHKDRGETDLAIACFRRSLAIEPNNADAWISLGTVLKQQGQMEEATQCFRKTVAIQPGHAEAYYLLGTQMDKDGKRDEAIACYQQAVALNPGHALAFNNLGVAFFYEGKLEEAETNYRRALALMDNLAEIHVNLGNALRDQGRSEEALACFAKALEVNPDSAGAHFLQTMAMIPLFYDSEDQVETARRRYNEALVKLDAWCSDDRAIAGADIVGSCQPFYLAYQEENHRVSLSRYGDICARLMGQWQAQQGLAVPRHPPHTPLRVGIVSAHIHNQSVWNAIVRGWFEHLNPNRFELYVYYLGTKHDEETTRAIGLAKGFEQGRRTLQQWSAKILQDQPDILIYPEIGMDVVTTRLASMRLAPVQAASWGHPESTGLPTIDYYLSADDLEPPDAQQNYRERLVLLPHLGCCYQPEAVETQEPDWQALGIDGDVPLLLAPGVPFKYLPQHDHIFVDIARELGSCRFVFFHTQRQGALSPLLRQRLERRFAEAGLDFAQYGTFIPWQKKPSFYGLMKHAHVFLDTIGFSGFNTAMQAVECGLPVVTREGRFMRGRLASGILKRLELPELIAANNKEYVELAVRLVRDSAYRKQLSERIVANRDILCGDTEPIRALEEFLVNATQGISA